MDLATRYLAPAPARFLWEHFGEDDPLEVVVFDKTEGLTHLVDGAAWAVAQLLQAHPGGLTLRELVDRLCGPGNEGGEDSGYNDVDEAAQATEGLTRLLEVMTGTDLVIRVPA